MRALAVTLCLCVLALAGAPPARSADGAGADMTAALRILDAAPASGLPAQDVQGLAQALADPDAAVAQAAEARLRQAAVGYVLAQHGGRIAPREVNRSWSPQAPPADLAADYQKARDAGDLAAWLTGAAPADPRYRALVAARASYAAMAAQGGWQALPAAPKGKGADPRIPELRLRLAAEGYDAAAAAGEDPAQMDARLGAALDLFRRRHGLAPGGLDADALAALNVPAAGRLAQIDANLERWRWLPRALPARRIEVDVAAAELLLAEPGAPDLRMRVIVGQPSWPTPLFAAEVTSVVFNPPWVVPASIARAEVWPTERLQPGYLARHHYSVIDGQLVQAPGPDSALGEVKFDFVSPYGVYLHDTPSRGLFARERRMLSHGCVRLQQPRELALRLLAPRGWTEARVTAVVATRRTTRTAVRPTPLFVVYRTAEAGPDGAVWFRPDGYGWDGPLAAALAAVDRRQGAAPRRPGE